MLQDELGCEKDLQCQVRDRAEKEYTESTKLALAWAAHQAASGNLAGPTGLVSSSQPEPGSQAWAGVGRGRPLCSVLSQQSSLEQRGPLQPSPPRPLLNDSALTGFCSSFLLWFCCFLFSPTVSEGKSTKPANQGPFSLEVSRPALHRGQVVEFGPHSALGAIRPLTLQTPPPASRAQPVGLSLRCLQLEARQNKATLQKRATYITRTFKLFFLMCSLASKLKKPCSVCPADDHAVFAAFGLCRLLRQRGLWNVSFRTPGPAATLGFPSPHRLPWSPPGPTQTFKGKG